MKVLIVGAGAVGLPYARHLELAGAKVSFLVKPKYAAAARAGYVVYQLNRSAAERWNPVPYEGFGVLESEAEVARERWDAIIVTVSSTALRAGSWFDDLARASGDATLITLQPGAEDLAYVRARVPAARVVQGLIGLVSYQAPLPGETVARPGVAYWVPPLQPALTLDGPADRARPIVEALARGGMRALYVPEPGVAKTLAFVGPLLAMHVIALEIAGWRFAALRADRALMRLAGGAAREVMEIGARRLGLRVPLGPRIARWFMRFVLWLAPKLFPFDADTYFRVHFTKVGDQTRQEIGTQLRLGAEHGVPTPALRGLSERFQSMNERSFMKSEARA